MIAATAMLFGLLALPEAAAATWAPCAAKPEVDCRILDSDAITAEYLQEGTVAFRAGRWADAAKALTLAAALTRDPMPRIGAAAAFIELQRPQDARSMLAPLRNTDDPDVAALLDDLDAEIAQIEAPPIASNQPGTPNSEVNTSNDVVGVVDDARADNRTLIWTFTSLSAAGAATALGLGLHVNNLQSQANNYDLSGPDASLQERDRYRTQARNTAVAANVSLVTTGVCVGVAVGLLAANLSQRNADRARARVSGSAAGIRVAW